MKKLEVGQFIEAKFACLNKNETIEEYKNECSKPEVTYEVSQEGENGYPRIAGNVTNWRIDKCRIDGIVNLIPEEYNELVNSLLDERPYFRGQGGDIYTGTNEELNNPDGCRDLYNRPDLLKELRRHHARKVILINCEGYESFVVDPQGYAYARYVGFIV